ncbi:methyltransferase [Streptomyces venezuelae]|uniref:Methyltransferase n=1 Tax=Streptomyces venezuelae TaxID=54571 RepID=A0A5P2DCR2_STRVZ|nr:methyltransferase [Streptomyces venezuelae]QES52882.1 methyltransferase [Streptomyces venezuelae]
MTTTLPDETLLLDDTACLSAAARFVREHDSAALLPLLLPGLGGPDLQALAGHCRFAHAGLLLFPPDADGLRTQLADCGLAVDTPSHPSVVVRERLARRHRRDPAELDVRILRPQVLASTGERRAVEVFALMVPPQSDLEPIAAHERTRQHEAHLAFEAEHPDPLALRGLCSILARHGARPDGGGYNPHEDGTVLYFTLPDSACAYQRLELYARGDHRGTLAAHLDRPGQDAGQPAETLLHLLTGAWTTQALATFARLGLPDVMDTRTARRAEDLARPTGSHPRSLAVLLRYLTMLGAVTQDPGQEKAKERQEEREEGQEEGGFRLTELGALLRADTPGSMRSLALMYGGPFYRSFGGLDHAVRTGQPAFDHLFGENHFDHFARDPELAALFDRSMAASSRMFQPLPAHPVLTAAAQAPAAATVVDVAGGNGELLGRILTAHPRLRGVLLERPHAVEAARRRLDAAGCGARCDYRAGDFADVPAGGDVYVLSRVLHDWDDDRCREILRHCVRAMPAHADLLVVERLLPADGSPSLATAWDLHMLCNVGGRERRADHYARLLADAGLRLVGHRPLPLDAHVLHARRAGAPDPATPRNSPEPAGQPRGAAASMALS